MSDNIGQFESVREMPRHTAGGLGISMEDFKDLDFGGKRTWETAEADRKLILPMTITMDGKEIDLRTLSLQNYGGLHDNNTPEGSPPIDVSDINVLNVTAAETEQISRKANSLLRHAMGLPSHSDANTPDEVSLDSSELKLAIDAAKLLKQFNPEAYDAIHSYLLNPVKNPKPKEMEALEGFLFEKFIHYERKRNMVRGS